MGSFPSGHCFSWLFIPQVCASHCPLWLTLCTSHPAPLFCYPLPSSLAQINPDSLGVCRHVKDSISPLFFILFNCYSINSMPCFLQASLLQWLFALFVPTIKNPTSLWGNMGTSESLLVRFSYKWKKANIKISILRCLTANDNVNAVDIAYTDDT